MMPLSLRSCHTEARAAAPYAAAAAAVIVVVAVVSPSFYQHNPGLLGSGLRQLGPQRTQVRRILHTVVERRRHVALPVAIVAAAKHILCQHVNIALRLGHECLERFAGSGGLPSWFATNLVILVICGATCTVGHGLCLVRIIICVRWLLICYQT